MLFAQIPETVATLTNAFVAALDEMLGDRFVGLFLYGAVCFPPSAVTDFDGHVLLSDPFDGEDRAAIRALQERLRSLPLGDEFDVYYITMEDAGRREKPAHQWDPRNVDNSWAIHRAHVHAGRFVLVKGPDPREIVPVPSWPELDNALQGELDFVASHLDDAPAYCTLNLCRILASYENRDVVLSKLQAGIWAIGALDVDHHTRIRAALSAYEAGKSGAGEPELVDVRSFYEDMSARIERARALG